MVEILSVGLPIEQFNLQSCDGLLIIDHISFDGYYFSPIYRTYAIRQGLAVPGGLDAHTSKLMW